MPVIHYGSILEQDLMELWKTEACKFYRERFAERVKAHEDTIVESLVGSSSNREKALKAAREAMPEAPQGCKVCHYLYDI